jgi:hypothetical protein
MRFIQKPGIDEYPPYSSAYMDLIPADGDILTHLWNNFIALKELVYSLPEEKLYYRYAPGKWTIKEILVHNIDDERIFSYRALRYARNDKTELPGFEQDDYAFYSNANERTLESIFEEYEHVRKSTISLFKYLPEDSLMRAGTSIGNVNRRTVRALAYHIAGHEQRHVKLIRERYLAEIPYIDDVTTY